MEYDYDSMSDPKSADYQPPMTHELPQPHYHTIAGTPGYIPDYNELFDTREDARADARWYVEAYHDMAADDTANGTTPYYRVDESDPDYIVVDQGEPDSYALSIIVQVIECADRTCQHEEE
jgi:hypothetical protein